jgi:hypothetical protein
MKRFTRILGFAAGLALLGTGAWAVPVYNYGAGDLASVFSDIGLGYDVVADQSNNAYYAGDAFTNSSSAFLFTDVYGIGNFAGDFGLYSKATHEKLSLFNSNYTGTTSVKFYADGHVRAIYDDIPAAADTLTTFGRDFGFYIDFSSPIPTFAQVGAGGIYYSDPTMNPSYVAPDQNTYSDWMIMFQGDGTVLNPYNGLPGGAFTPNQWLICADGVLQGPGLLGFNDAVVMVESIQPIIPEPGTILLLGAGLVALGVTQRKRGRP